MACDTPLAAFASDRDPSSRRVSIFFSQYAAWRAGLDVSPVSLPCGSCVGCRLDAARDLAVRASHEAQLHFDSEFITLTYDEDSLPAGGVLCRKDLSDFWKRLRINLQRSGVHNGFVRYLACGEYGDTTFRPHYHAIVYGYVSPDRMFWKHTPSGPLFRSPFLERTWGKGQVVAADVSPGTISYVARYALKKARAIEFRVDSNGEVHKEFRTWSTVPGLGSGWFEYFKNDVDVRSDSLFVERGVTARVPRYYLSLLEADDSLAVQAIKEARLEVAAAALSPDRVRAADAKRAVRDARLSLYSSKGI